MHMKCVTSLAAVCAPFPCHILRKKNFLDNITSGSTESTASRLEFITSAVHRECCIFPERKPYPMHVRIKLKLASLGCYA